MASPTPLQNNIAVDAGKYAYAANSSIQRLIYKECERYLPDLEGRKTITVVDYGCGQGQNWTLGLDLLLSKADEDVQYQLVLNDVVKNDWNEVTQAVDRYRAERRGNQEGHFSLLPASFYQQVMPNNSVDVGMAWSSFHWIEGVLPPMEAPPDEAYYAAWQDSIRSQGHAGLIKLLRLRAREIVPGGQLLFVIPTSSSSTGKVHSIALTAALKRCLEDGIMTHEQYRAFNAPFFQPNEDDLRQILSAVQDLWDLPIPWGYPTLVHPAWTKLQESEETHRDYAGYAEGMAGFVMALYGDVLVRALRCGETIQCSSRTAEEVAFLEDFKDRLKEALLSEPLRHKRAESSWLVVRLDRKAERRASGSTVKL